MSIVKFSNELRKAAKRANQRMVELEKRGINSPAYRQAQSILEMLGKRSTASHGRRFSETGKGTENELRQLEKALNNFLNAETSTLTGYKEWKKNVYEGADKTMNLKKAGITSEQYAELFETLPDETDRMYYATFYIEVLQTYQMKIDTGQIKEENALNITDIIRIMEGSKNYKSALKEIGLTMKDVNQTRNKLKRL